MKKKPQPTETEDQLPDFLGKAAPTETIEADAAADAEAEAEAEAQAESTARGEDESVAAEAPHEDDNPSLDPETPLVVQTPADSSHGETAKHGGGRAGNKSLLLGVLLGVSAIVLAAMPASATVTQLTHFGVGPQTLLILGAILFAGGVTRRRVGALVQRIDDVEKGDRDWAQSARESLHFLVEAQQLSNERPPAAGEELQHVLVALQRQDDKLANLTKAVKMYGKPLMEISSQGTELGGSLAQMKSALEAVANANRAAFAQLESRVQANGTPAKELNELLEVVLKIDDAINTLRTKSNAPSLEPLQQQVGRLEVNVAAIGQRLEDSEVRKSLLRLEEVAQQTNTELHKVRGDGLQKATAHLEERLDKATGRLSDGLQQIRQTNLAGLEGTVRDLQRELSGVATAVAQIHAAVRSGARPGAVAPAATAAPAAPVATAAAAMVTAGSAAPANAAAASGDPNGYQTGVRSTSSKNVLGAIAKLKQMKT